MSSLPFEAFLALRYLRPRRTFVSIITVISILGVMLGVAVLIIVNAVMSGFDKEWRTRILGFNAHLKVMHRSGLIADYERVQKLIASNSAVRGMAPFVAGQVLLKTQPKEGQPKFLAPLLRGIDVDLEKSVSILPDSIKTGAYDVGGRGLLIGRDLAQNLELNVGDRLSVYSPANIAKIEEALSKQKNGAAGEPDRMFLPSEFVVRGIFDVGFAEYNASIVVSSIQRAQEMYDIGDENVHIIQIKLDDPFHAYRVRDELEARLGASYRVITWQEENPQLFNALAVEKNMIAFLLFFIVIVAAFGIINSQITFVVQKTREIGILKAIGATSSQILALFVSQALVIGVAGVGVGLGLGLLVLKYRSVILATLNKVTGIEVLPASIYQLYELPAEILVGDIAMICGCAFAACVLAGVIPAWIASRLQPVAALRHE